MTLYDFSGKPEKKDNNVHNLYEQQEGFATPQSLNFFNMIKNSLMRKGRKEDLSKIFEIGKNELEKKENNVILKAKAKQKDEEWNSKIKKMHLKASKIQGKNEISKNEELFLQFAEIIEGNKFIPNYQMIVGEDPKGFKYEVLGRGELDSGEEMSAYHLFSVAKALGLAEYINKEIYTKAIEDLKENEGGLSINLNEKELNDDFYCLNLINLVRSKKIDPSKITIEIVEDVSRFSKKTIDRFRDEGFKIALDDAPKGYNSTNRLIELKPDIIKIDRENTLSLIEKNLIKGESVNLIKKRKNDTLKLIETAVALGCEIVLEGIEEGDLKNMCNFIKDKNITNVKFQGFAIHKPSRTKNISGIKSHERIKNGNKDGQMAS